LEKGTVELVDVGGGHGACLKQILIAYPDLDAKKCVLQDRPDVIEMAKASGAMPEGLVLMAHDFRTEQPIKGM
jgi:O-methyltransferase domain